jgi:hypothetical protein
MPALPSSLWGFSPNDKENAQFCAFSTLQTPKGAQKSTNPTGSERGVNEGSGLFL